MNIDSEGAQIVARRTAAPLQRGFWEQFKTAHKIKIISISQSFRCPQCKGKSELIQFSPDPGGKLQFAVVCSNINGCDRVTGPASSMKEAWHLWNLAEKLAFDQ